MKKVLLFLIYTLVCSQIMCNDIYFKHLTTNNDTYLSSAISIWQDKLGNMWFGNNLLNKYNGNNVKSYKLSDKLKSPQNPNVRQIGGYGHFMYALAGYELVIYDTSTEKLTATGIDADCIYINNDTLYFSKNNSLFLYNPHNETPEKIADIPKESLIIKTVLIDSNRNVYLGTNKGLYIKNDTIDGKCIIDEIDVTAIFKDSQKNIWIGTTDDGIRIIQYENNDIATFNEDTPYNNSHLYNDRIRCINEDDNQNIWIGTYEGITLYSPISAKSQALKHNEFIPYSLKHNSIYSIYKDKQGTMWVGTYYGGVSYYNPHVSLYTYYGVNRSEPSMLQGMIIGNMVEDNKDNLYIATEEGGINVLNRNTENLKKYDKSNGHLPHNTIKSIWYDKEYDHLIVGTYTEGLLVKDRDSEQFRKVGRHVLITEGQKIINQISPYNDEYALVLTQDGIYRLNRKNLELTNLAHNSILKSSDIGYIKMFATDSDGTLWLSSINQNLFRMDMQTGNIHLFEGQNSILDKSIIVELIEHSDNKIYILTQSGLLRYDKNKQLFEDINIKSLPSDNYCNMEFLKSGKIIITSNNGITLFDPNNNSSIYLSLSKIFPLNSINSSCGLYVSPKDETIFIGGIEGMLTLTEKGITSINTPSDKSTYELFLSSLHINNKEVSSQNHPKILSEDISFSKSIKLNHKQNNISLTFASSNYINTDNTLYEYMLSGFDHQWTSTTDKVIRYTSLPPGDYHLTIREANSHKSIDIELIITPPFYATSLAYIIYSLLAILILIYIIRFTQRNLLLKASLKMEQREKLHLAELNQMKMNFFTNISHEFRTPLTLISSQIDLALKDIDLSQSIRKRFSKIKKYTHDLRILIDELMYFKKLEQGDLPIRVSKQNITDFLDKVYLSFKEYAQTQKINFTFEHTNEPIDVWFDASQLQKVIYNLLSNAFKFTNEGDDIRLILKKRKDHVDIVVEDTGIGIPKTDLDKIFEQFYQVNNEQASSRLSQGMGVGLSFSKSIVEQHKGKIFAESIMGQMSRFTVQLQLGEAHFSEEEKKEEIADQTYIISDSLWEQTGETDIQKNEEIEYNEAKTNILIIEDNEELTKLLTEAFISGYNVSIAHDGVSGLEKAFEIKPDIILSDILLPRMTGLEVCKKLKSHAETSHIPIILITARSSIKQNIEGLLYGADDYIIKPFDLELLLLKCNNLVKIRKELQDKFHSQEMSQSNKDINLTTSKADQRFLEEAISIVEANLSNTSFNTVTWAMELKIGRSKLFDKLKSITGYTPNEYLIIIKMKRASLLLNENPNMTIAEIAYTLGFSSPGYFSKVFKEQFGQTPLQYRQKT